MDLPRRLDRCRRRLRRSSRSTHTGSRPRTANAPGEPDRGLARATGPGFRSSRCCSRIRSSCSRTDTFRHRDGDRSPGDRDHVGTSGPSRSRSTAVPTTPTRTTSTSATRSLLRHSPPTVNVVRVAPLVRDDRAGAPPSRRSSSGTDDPQGDEREQIRWLMLAGGVTVFWFVLPLNHGVGGWADFVQGSRSDVDPDRDRGRDPKYRLYDIDLVIRKTVVFGVLAVFITLVYVAIVVGVGTAVGSSGEPGPLGDRGGDRGARVPARAALGTAPGQPARLRAAGNTVRGALRVLEPAR